jgi:Protein of unknown function (DUF3050)
MDTAVVLDTVAISEARATLSAHPLYNELTSIERLRIFMKHHVFAVWDFFSLLKRLQTEVTCVSCPWLPRGLGDHARFITEIVLAEECDEGLDGHHLSHFELYRAAMAEVGADTRPIDGFVESVRVGVDPLVALEHPSVPATVRAFVADTLRVAIHGDAHEVAASFCHGRENLLPDVLGRAREEMTEILDQAPIFKHYLDRHIALDHEEHGPLALRLLAATCGGDEARIARADRVAVEAIEARARLWDGVLSEIAT